MQNLSISRNKFGVRILEQYFVNLTNQHTVDQRYDLIVNYCSDQPEIHNRKIYTLLIDLLPPEEAIFKGLRKNYRRDIRSVCKEFITSMEVAPDDRVIERFCETYNDFADEKKLAHCNEEKLKLLARNKMLIISQINRPGDHEMLCTHAYIHDGNRSRLFHSVSRFREFGQDPVTRNQWAKVHRYLHWSDIKQLKCRGFSTYDLGGITVDNLGELNNINSFKRGFGGIIRQEFVNAYPQSIRGWLAMKYLLRQL